MTPADLQHFLDERHMTKRAFGLAIQVSQDRLRRWLAGEQRIPRHIALACMALAAGLPPWPASGLLSMTWEERPTGAPAEWPWRAS